MNPDFLEREINARMALRQLKEQFDLILELGRMEAQAKRTYYETLLQQGFSPHEALTLTANHDPFKQR